MMIWALPLSQGSEPCSMQSISTRIVVISFLITWLADRRLFNVLQRHHSLRSSRSRRCCKILTENTYREGCSIEVADILALLVAREPRMVPAGSDGWLVHPGCGLELSERAFAQNNQQYMTDYAPSLASCSWPRPT